MRRTYARPVAHGPGAGQTTNGGPVAAAEQAKKWTPTVANLLVLIVVEMVAFAAIRYAFRRVLD